MTNDDARPKLILMLAIASIMSAAFGCTRDQYRVQADSEAYNVIQQSNLRNVDPNVAPASYSIDMDPRSRFFDIYDPDFQPMPMDDPASHQYMDCVNGMEGWQHWHDNGQRPELENPNWRNALDEMVEQGEEGIRLDINRALELAYIHSPDHQSQLETLYLSALDVTEERFRLDSQYFGGYDAIYNHNGSLAPSSLRFDPTTGMYVVSTPTNNPGGDSNRLTIGLPSAGDPALQFRRQFATAGELVAGFANSFVFEFTGGDANLASSLASFSLVQPLLRGAGRDIALEQLTRAERNMLANMRAYGQYRQGLYTQVAVGELGVVGPQRGGRGTSLQIFGGQGGLGGYIGLVQNRQQIRNSEDNLALQERTFAQLLAFQEIGAIDLVQVEQFRQNIESERANLLRVQNDYQASLDRFKTNTLGLPPDLPLELDEALIQQFQLVPRDATLMQETIGQLQDAVGVLPKEVTVEQLVPLIDQSFSLIEPVRRQLDAIYSDLELMESRVSEREATIPNPDEREAFRLARLGLYESLAEREMDFRQASLELSALRVWLRPSTAEYVRDDFVEWLGLYLRLIQRAVLITARARLESITIDSIQLDPNDALDIALANRLDFMNARAALVDNWRLIQVNADALQSVLNVTASGDIRTARNNPLSFRAPTGSMRLGLEFDAPFTRLVERNDYREALVSYQQSRRGFIQSVDRLHLDLRQLLRTVEQLRLNLEIQRLSVGIAIRRVDLTRAELNEPVPPPQPGQTLAQFNPTTATNLLSALSSLRDSQDALLGVWLNYYAVRMRLARELGIMAMDENGVWIEYPLPSSEDPILIDEGVSGPASLGIPPMLMPEGFESRLLDPEFVDPALWQQAVEQNIHHAPMLETPLR